MFRRAKDSPSPCFKILNDSPSNFSFAIYLQKKKKRERVLHWNKNAQFTAKFQFICRPVETRGGDFDHGRSLRASQSLNTSRPSPYAAALINFGSTLITKSFDDGIAESKLRRKQILKDPFNFVRPNVRLVIHSRRSLANGIYSCYKQQRREWLVFLEKDHSIIFPRKLIDRGFVKYDREDDLSCTYPIDREEKKW